MASIKDKLKTINISDIKPYEANAKKHPQSQIENLKTSIDKYGYYSPVGVDKNNEIVIGHGRYMALMEADSEQKIDVIDFSNLSQKEIKKLRILDNKIVSDEWDMELLQKEIEDIYDEEEINPDEIGISEEDINKMFNKEDPKEFRGSNSCTAVFCLNKVGCLFCITARHKRWAASEKIINEIYKVGNIN